MPLVMGPPCSVKSEADDVPVVRTSTMPAVLVAPGVPAAESCTRIVVVPVVLPTTSTSAIEPAPPTLASSAMRLVPVPLNVAPFITI